MVTSSLPRHGGWPWPSRAFLAIAAVQAAANIALEASLMAQIRQGPFTSTQAAMYLVYGSSFIAAQVVALLLTAVALRARSTPLVAAAAAADLLLVAFRAALLLQQAAARDRVMAMQTAGLGTLALGCAAKAFLALRYLRREFGQQVSRAGPTMRRMLLCRQVLLVLVVLAGLCFLQVWAQRVAAAVLAGPSAMRWAEIVATPIVCMAVLSASLAAAVHERRWAMYMCVGVFASAPAYIIYRLVVAVTGWYLGNADVDEHNASSKYMAVLLAVLLALDVALALVSLAVVWDFGRGLQQRLRHVYIITRKDVDLESGVYGGHSTHTAARRSTNDQQPGDNDASGAGSSQPTAGGILSRMVASTNASLNESTLLFRAFFFGLDVPDEPAAIEATEKASTQPTLQLHHSIPKFSTTAFQDMFGSACPTAFQGSRDLGVADEPPRSSESTECGSLHCDDAAMSDPDMPRLGSYESFRPDSRPDTPVTLELLLSIEELNTINGELAVAASASSINRSWIGGGGLAASCGSPAPSWSLVSSASFRTSMGWASGSVISSARLALAGYADEFSLQAAVQSPLALRVACPDDISVCSDDISVCSNGGDPALQRSGISRADTLGLTRPASASAVSVSSVSLAAAY
ncbi:hypothetical protein H4R19_002466 [Coemansia spiralis]|nr:hypothetical protein H4R19_002466 [Coemansia spiralis]